MKRNFVIIILIVSIVLEVTHSSCGSQKGGCYGTRGMTGYK
jgi:hypothetical protein